MEEKEHLARCRSRPRVERATAPASLLVNEAIRGTYTVSCAVGATTVDEDHLALIPREIDAVELVLQRIDGGRLVENRHDDRNARRTLPALGRHPHAHRIAAFARLSTVVETVGASSTPIRAEST